MENSYIVHIVKTFNECQMKEIGANSNWQLVECRKMSATGEKDMALYTYVCCLISATTECSGRGAGGLLAASSYQFRFSTGHR